MSTTQKIRYSDCDPQGIVFNGNYARYWDDAITDWFEELGFGGTEMGGIGVEYVTVRLEIDFKAVVKLGETLVTEVAVERFGVTSMTVVVTTIRDSDRQIVAAGKAVYVFVDPEEFTPITVPEPFREAAGE